MKQNVYINKVINLYNNLNNEYIYLKNKILHYIILLPLKFGMSKMFNNASYEVESNINLKSNKDINNFLDRLLEKNK